MSCEDFVLVQFVDDGFLQVYPRLKIKESQVLKKNQLVSAEYLKGIFYPARVLRISKGTVYIIILSSTWLCYIACQKNTQALSLP